MKGRGVEAARRLLEGGADVSHTDSDGNTPLSIGEARTLPVKPGPVKPGPVTPIVRWSL